MMAISQNRHITHLSFLHKKVEKYPGLSDSGFSLMMEAFNCKNPRIRFTPLSTQSEQDEQEGYRFVFAGGVKALRNPRAHEFSVVDILTPAWIT